MQLPKRRIRVRHVRHDLADIWIAGSAEPQPDYSYGGTRLVPHNCDDAAAIAALSNLATYESGVKNALINGALADGAVSSLRSRLPTGFEHSIVHGGRCIIRPVNTDTERVLNSPGTSEFLEVANAVFAVVGDLLNAEGGTIKLTPDFGRFAGLANILYAYTPHVLGVRCEWGGCGGKSSYTVTGILQAIEMLWSAPANKTPSTLIGSAGALGSGVLERFRAMRLAELGLCDLAYNSDPPLEENERLLPAALGTFTDSCLRRGGLIVATTFGNELVNSRHELMPEGSVLFLAHNNALPSGGEGVRLAAAIASRGVFVVPGQLLTLGGAGVARLEWFWRQSRPAEPFDKALAHDVVRHITRHVVTRMRQLMTPSRLTPYEAILGIANDAPS